VMTHLDYRPRIKLNELYSLQFVHKCSLVSIHLCTLTNMAAMHIVPGGPMSTSLRGRNEEPNILHLFCYDHPVEDTSLHISTKPKLIKFHRALFKTSFTLKFK